MQLKSLAVGIEGKMNRIHYSATVWQWMCLFCAENATKFDKMLVEMFPA